MKYRTTNKDIKNGYSKVLKVGYCGLQSLLSCTQPTAYTCGIYGWNADIYDFGDIAICTGYRPIGTSVDYDLCDYYEKKAQQINEARLSWDERKGNLEHLLAMFIKEATEN